MCGQRTLDMRTSDVRTEDNKKKKKKIYLVTDASV
jgi:hypothetical protein